MKLLKLLSVVSLTLLFTVYAFAIPTKEEAAKLAAENQSEVFTVGQSRTVTIGDEELPVDEADVAVTIGFPGANLGQAYPVYDYWHQVASVGLYLASEITGAGGAAGLITHLRWYCHTTTSWSPGRQVWIYIKPTTATTIATGQSWATISSGATLVYDSGAQNYLGPGAAGSWKEWDITDFNWNGTDNLLIMMRSYRPGYTSSTAPWRYQSGQTNRHWYRQADAADLGATAGTLTANRPSIQFEIQTAPDAPSSPSPANGATNIPTNATLTWTNGAGTSWVDVYLDTNNPPTTMVYDDLVGNSWSPPTNLNPNTIYYWRIHAFNNQGNTLGPVWSFTTGAGASPNAPSGGTITNATNSSLTLGWTDNSNNEDSFNIHYSTNGTTFNWLTDVGANVTTYIHTGLGPNTQNWYRVYATGNGFQSTGFASMNGWTLCNTPGAPGVTVPAAPTGYTGVTITGLPADGNPATTIYRVGVNDANNNFLGWILSGGNPREATAANWVNIAVSGLSSNVTYKFFASAKNGAGVFTNGPTTTITTLNYHIGGPDNYTYYYKSSSGPAGDPTVTFNWITLDNPTELVLSGDDNEANISFGSFWFPFYGNIYNGGRMGTNGAFAFNVSTGDIGWSNTTLPTSTTNISNSQAAIFPFWDDHDWLTSNRCQYQNFGSYFVIQVTNSPRYNANTELISYQVILYADGRIKYQYQGIVGTGWTPTIGIQGHSTLANGLFLQFAGAQTTMIPPNNYAILFYRRANQPYVSTPPTNVSAGGNYSANGAVIDGFSFVGTPPAGSYVSSTEILNPNYFGITGSLPGGYTPGSDPIAEGLATGAVAAPVIVQISHNMTEPFSGFTACLTFTVPNGVNPSTVRAAWRPRSGIGWTIVPNAAPYSYTFGPGQSVTVCGLTHYSEWLLLSEEVLLPVQMSSFTASGGNSQVILNWRTESEVNNHHFNIYRSESENVVGELIATVLGQGTSTSGHIYRYIDTRVINGKTYYYRIADVDVDGIESMYPYVVHATPVSIIPNKYELQQNIPNPFNPITEIRYSIKEAGKVELSVFDVNGREVARLVDDYQTPNVYSVNFDAKNLPAGVYFYQLRAGKFTAVKKMMLVK
ncbi:MAG: T9SS type A sorting domain-containing protein [bacterium]|nr:T9SS type A sorting domain-containing protein [bacterium]